MEHCMKPKVSAFCEDKYTNRFNPQEKSCIRLVLNKLNK
ncbi:MAG: hypothetical protein ACI9SG_000636 [Maribacter sp.]|jgi:hypothetical protein